MSEEPVLDIKSIIKTLSQILGIKLLDIYLYNGYIKLSKVFLYKFCWYRGKNYS